MNDPQSALEHAIDAAEPCLNLEEPSICQLLERRHNISRLRRRANDYRRQECNTMAHRDRCDHAAGVLDQVADEIEGDLEQEAEWPDEMAPSELRIEIERLQKVLQRKICGDAVSGCAAPVHGYRGDGSHRIFCACDRYTTEFGPSFAQADTEAERDRADGLLIADGERQTR